MTTPDTAQRLLYKVDVTETVERSFYVWADSKEEAQEGAEALASFVPEDDSDDNAFVRVFAGEPPEGAWVWSGGPEGDWISRAGLGDD